MTDAEKAFLTMCRMTEIGTTIGMMARIAWAERENDFSRVTNIFVPKRPDTFAALWFDRAIQSFPIVASTFEALTVERPELRGHYERAKAAWEATC